MVKNKIVGKQTVTRLAFHWNYILLPVVILLISIILTAYFYSRLPVEVAYYFKSDGSPARWLSRSAIILWMLLPQLFLTLLALALTWGITRLSILFRQIGSPRIKLEKVLFVMGSMVALPQIVLGFAMLDIFSYNSFQIHLLPLWVFALITASLGSIILGIFFIQAIRQAWGANR